ncbi:sugar-binding transcriptional regulator [Conservatibacter flavescens]|uniref:DNA-binding transcriptional regulator n=1 Tax=Conservatibacter flavescens TaxID=28161 RepID=A0A2M8S2G5_9PAST|nr:sugar-binding transcriptional regulator [Conservatibacter flavescens]PJG85325.1 DNA-binding transcriptional regulator [Conservatibacter flavescens]
MSFTLTNEKRLLAQIATLYYEDNLKQSEIAKRLNLSQPFVSRSLTKCIAEGIVKISIIPPAGIYLDLEQQLQKKFNLDLVMVIDVDDTDEDRLKTAIGTTAAYYLQVALQSNELVGVSAWSGTIQRMVDHMPQFQVKAKGVVQLLGGVGVNGNVQANLLTYELAKKLNCSAYLLPSQSLNGNIGNIEYKEQLLDMNEVSQVVNMFEQVDVALVGIGMLEPSELLKNSGLYYKKDMLHVLAQKGAVGDICLHYFDQQGKPVLSEQEDPIIGMGLELIKKCPRVVALAGGREKIHAIKAALIGQYINVLVIDRETAKLLL